MKLQELAKVAGVSKTTVSMVLNGQGEKYRIRPDTIETVMQIAKEHHYQPNHYAKGLRKQHTKTIGVIVPDVCNPFFASLIKDLDIAARTNGQHIIIESSNDNLADELKAIYNLQARQVDGIILASIQAEDKAHTINIPLVAIDRKFSKGTTTCISSNNKASALALCQHLIKQDCKRIAYIGGNINLSTNKERLAGYKNALKEAGFRCIRALVQQKDYSVSWGKTAAKNLLKCSTPPDAIFCASYTLAEGLLRYLHQHQPKALESLHIACIDHHPLLDVLPANIVYAKQNTQTMAELSLKALDNPPENPMLEVNTLLSQRISR